VRRTLLDKNYCSVFHRQNISFKIDGATYTYRTEETDVDRMQKSQFYT